MKQRIIIFLLFTASLFADPLDWFLLGFGSTLAEEVIASNPGYFMRIDADGKYMKDADNKYILCRVTSQYASLIKSEFQNYALNKRNNYNEKIIFDDKLFALILQRKRTRDSAI